MIREFKCPYGDDFEGGDECDSCEQYELCMETYPPVNLIEIPKGATNGDILKIVFPNIEWKEIHDFKGNKSIGCTNEFWYAPYKRGDSDGSN